jgi:hypothetical protein
LALALGASAAHAVPLAPALAGQYGAGSGVDATFLKVADDWQLSSVLWNEALGQHGSGVPVSSYAWGTGLWGIADWQTANAAGSDMVQDSWSGRVSAIRFGDDRYNTDYAATWGAVNLAPLFTPGVGQNNWTSSFAGYIRITEAGEYNFSVLHDDGFFFNLHGAGNQTLSLQNDYLNPRDSLGYSSNLLLGVGLYSFELGAYDRLEAGVVELSWRRGNDPWTTVPTANLVAHGEITPVPEPASWALLLAGGAALLARRRRRV